MMAAELSVALATLATLIGAGFASGREIVTFFSSMGAYSWVGIVVCSAATSALIGMLCLLAVRTHARSLPALYGALMNQPCEDAVQMLHGLLLLLCAGVMVSAGGELGALALSSRYARWWGMGCTLAISALASLSGTRALSWMGALLVPAIAVYYVALLCAAPAPEQNLLPWQTGKTTEIFASLPLAGLLGALYAALNCAMAGSVVVNASQQARGVRPWRCACLTGGMLLLLLLLANGAICKAGVDVQRMALPSVALAAQWGLPGYYCSIGALWVAVVTTLAGALCSLSAQAQRFSVGGASAIGASCALSLLMALVGFAPLVEIGYPLMGWGSALALLALTAYVSAEEKPQKPAA